MFEIQESKQPELSEDKQQLPEMDAIVGLFELLMSVDRRLNPQSYD